MTRHTVYKSTQAYSRRSTNMHPNWCLALNHRPLKKFRLACGPERDWEPATPPGPLPILPRTVSEAPRPHDEISGSTYAGVAAVVSIRRDEGSSSVWHEAAMRFESRVTGRETV